MARAETWPAIALYRQLITRNALNPKDQLRLQRHKLWLRCALATYFDRKTAKEICYFWSLAAEKLIHEAWELSGCAKLNFSLLALGKLGSRELNLSSDVDLIVVRADDQPAEVKAFRDFQSLLADITEFGYCLRVDFTLRPGGRAASAVPSVSEFEYHYGYHGEMWERLAFVRMRILEGPTTQNDELATFARKFSFRRHLDYTLLDELKALRSKIRFEMAELREDMFHLKLGEGGIREVELFVHALQIMHGGRHPSLRTFSTGTALAQIRELQLLPANECDFLAEAYWYLRTLENRLHCYEDQQNYSVNLQRDHPALPKGFSDQLQKTCRQVTLIATSLFGEIAARAELPEALEDQQQWLFKKGFSKYSATETWPQLLAATALSRRSDADEKARLIFLQGFVVKLAELNLDRDLGLSILLDFVKAVRAKSSFFTLLNRETRARDDLALLFSFSPYLGTLVAMRPELIDEFIFRKQADPPQDFNALLEELAERRLLGELISATHFLGDRRLRKMTLNLSANADAIALSLLERLKKDLGASNIGLIALGKWGGRELGLRSDLDFIFVTDQTPSAEDHKTAKRFLSRITEPHRGGSIYSVDLRLRPSGNSGPIMVVKAELERYLSESAAAWERQAYLRARPIGILGDDLGFHPGQVAAARGLNAADLAELSSIRSQLFSQTGTTEIDLKLSLGGLADVEFTAQIGLLARREFSLDPATCGMIQYLESIDARWKHHGEAIRNGYERLRQIEQLFQLTTSQSGSKIRLRSDEFRRLALVLGLAPDELETHVRKTMVEIANRLSALSHGGDGGELLAK